MNLPIYDIQAIASEGLAYKEERDRLKQLLAEVLPRLKRIASGRTFSDVELICHVEEASK